MTSSCVCLHADRSALCSPVAFKKTLKLNPLLIPLVWKRSQLLQTLSPLCKIRGGGGRRFPSDPSCVNETSWVSCVDLSHQPVGYCLEEELVAGKRFCHVAAHGQRMRVQAAGTGQQEPHPLLTAGGLPSPLEENLSFSLLLTFFLCVPFLMQGLLRARGSRAATPLHLPLPFRQWCVQLVHAQDYRQTATLVPLQPGL